ncbi:MULTISPECIES: hypothetical protein [Pseudomonadota]|jgi:hypothetical protein|uniref:Uncharacterized protein n=2 Tax=Burkholderiales TaxID=80840 RepID=A0A2R3QFZ8_9BURK|nr:MULTISPECIES: hypothetical protein [Pseudomonadota]MBS0599230.1 hypothetical protein [Pseudomonadota bacterium]AVO50680.1 hypothetical protein C6568_16640 [Melaminivora suipulveris]MCB5365012.1 hypothetical protein [Mesopusillimonas faecipullorum]MCO4018741.1 hypothetical protein [Pseudomonas aeruginosa]OOK51995.1 hypothetical protein BM548_18490 [Pseudomonas aeruginosa]
MNPTQSLRRPTFTVVVQSLLWLWLIGLSVFALRGHQAINDQADQQRLDTRLQRLEAQVAGLAATMQQQPAAATAAGLQDTRQALEARIAQIEQTMGGHATADDVLALRKEVEQIRARQTTPRATTPAQRRSPSQPVTAKPEPPPLPFRIVGAELRAGQRSLSVAPSSGDFTPDQLQVLLSGDAIGSWRLQAVEGSTAVFQTGDQTRRVAIP